MKNLLIFATLILSLAFVSCESIIDEPVYGLKTDQNFYTTETDALTAITGVYAQFTSYDIYSQYYFNVLEMASGGFTSPVPTGDIGKFIQKNYVSSSSMLSVLWQRHYVIINLCNQLIGHVPNMDIDASVKNSVYGEALYVRAMHYFNLVRMWGAVPLKIEETTGFSDAFYARSPESEVYNQIISDLKLAASLMPVTQSLKGRATKGAAYALLAKVYLTAASMKKYSGNIEGRFDFVTNPEAFYDSTRVYCDKVESLNTYSLVTDFMKQFPMSIAPDGTITHGGFENSSESIFEIQFISGNRLLGSTLPMFLIPWTKGGGYTYNNASWGTERVTKTLFNDFRTDHPGDYRLDITFLGGTTGILPTYKDGVVQTAVGDTLYVYPQTNLPAYPNIKECCWPYLAKYQDIDATASNQHGSNFVYLRYADVILMKAEAENELNNTGVATTYLNKLMLRARNANGITRLNPVDFQDNLSQDSLRELIWKERNYELLGEAHLWYDLIRTGKYKSFLEHYNAVESRISPYPSLESEMPYYERNVLFPIPASEILINDKMTQNKGHV